MHPIMSLFGRSPFGPLAQHAAQAREAVDLLRPLFASFLDRDRATTREIYERISKFEHKADVIKNDIRDHLPKSLLMPVDRGDVLLFLKEQDRLADRAEDLGVLLTMRDTPAPTALRPAVESLLEAVLATADAWFGVAAELPRLEGASFGGPEATRVQEQIRHISNLEWEADKRQAESGVVLFGMEDEIGAVSVVVWMRIFRILGELANAAENTADLLRLMLGRR
jgi:uncharacterized protein